MSPKASPLPSNSGSTASLLGALVTAALASACCIGPLLFGLAGLGGVGLLVRLERFRPLFGGITLSLLALGFYLTYRRPVEEECGCEPSPRRGRARITLWLAALLTVGILFGGPWLGRFAHGALPTASSANDAVTMLHVDGMTCASCAGPIRAVLAKLDGVHDVQIDLAHTRVRVAHAPGTASPAKLVAAIGEVGFIAREGR